MRYTKYKYKKNNDVIKLFISIILTMTIAIGIGNLGAKWIIGILPQELSVKADNINEVIDNTLQLEVGEKEITYSALQCGYFSKIENANHVLTKLSNYENAFIFEDETGKFRVIADVVNSEEAQETLKDLSERGIESAAINYSLKEGNNSQGHIAEIIKGQFEIINAFEDETVKEIEIAEFKAWVNALELSTEVINRDNEIHSEEGNNISENELLENHKEYIKNLPGKVERGNVKEQIKNIYSVIINFKK